MRRKHRWVGGVSPFPSLLPPRWEEEGEEEEGWKQEFVTILIDSDFCYSVFGGDSSSAQLSNFESDSGIQSDQIPPPPPPPPPPPLSHIPLHPLKHSMISTRTILARSCQDLQSHCQRILQNALRQSLPEQSSKCQLRSIQFRRIETVSTRGSVEATTATTTTATTATKQ